MRSNFSSLPFEEEEEEEGEEEESDRERSTIRSRSTESTGGKEEGEMLRGRLRGIGDGGKEFKEYE